jgi:hypothetical protein
MFFLTFNPILGAHLFERVKIGFFSRERVKPFETLLQASMYKKLDPCFEEERGKERERKRVREKKREGMLSKKMQK